MKSGWVVDTPWGIMRGFKSRTEAFKVFRALAKGGIPGWVSIGREDSSTHWGSHQENGRILVYKVRFLD